MRTPTALRKLDDRVLGRGRSRNDDEVYPDEPGGPVGTAHASTDRDQHDDRDRHDDRAPTEERTRSHRPAGDVVREVLGVVWTVSRYVFLALAALVVVGIVLTLAPTNEDNSLVSAGLSAAEWAAGPFRDVFAPDGENLKVLFNYGLAAAVYLVAASVMTRLPGKRGKTA